MHDPKGHYAALGLAPSATPGVVKFAYRELAQRYHPDRPTSDPGKMLAINKAWQVLADPIRRARYDDVGSDASDDHLDRRAATLLQSFFMQYLTDGGDGDDVVEVIHLSLNQGEAKQVKKRTELEATRIKIMRRTYKLRRRGKGMDLFAAQITHMLRDVELKIAAAADELEVLRRCRLLANEYEDGTQPHDDAVDSFVYMLQYFKQSRAQ